MRRHKKALYVAEAEGAYACEATAMSSHSSLRCTSQFVGTLVARRNIWSGCDLNRVKIQVRENSLLPEGSIERKERLNRDSMLQK